MPLVAPLGDAEFEKLVKEAQGSNEAQVSHILSNQSNQTAPSVAQKLSNQVSQVENSNLGTLSNNISNRPTVINHGTAPSSTVNPVFLNPLPQVKVL